MALDLKATPGNLVLAQLRGVRKELAVVLENQARDRQLILRLSQRMEEGFGSLQRDMTDIRSDLTLLENNLLSRHNEILDLARRVDDPEAPTP